MDVPGFVSTSRIMEHGSNEPEYNQTELFVRTSSAGSTHRRRSSSLSRTLPLQIEDIDSESVSEAGDVGDRALHSNRYSFSGSRRLSLDNTLENGVVFPVPEDTHDSKALDTTSLAFPLPEENVSSSKDNKQDKEKAGVLSPFFEYLSCLLYLAVFGILGVLTRYLLQKLFGPGVAGVTSDNYPLYLDLPSNMVGSFLMGWWGVVFKGDICRISDHLAIGLTTGYLGSLTTFSGWNQKMLDLSVDGDWVFSVVGILLGLFLAAYSIKFGIGTAKSFKLLLNSLNKSRTNTNWKVDSCKRHLAVILLLLLMLGLLWSVSGALLKEEFNTDKSGAQLWLACLVAAPGVWIRWFLARLNGRGLGKAGFLKWIPFGTLIANVSAACIMAGLATLKRFVHNETCDIVSTGIQFGFLGCLSTVSTFIAEYNAMEESNQSWRAYVYALITILVSFALGTLIYSVPIWVRG